MLHPRPITLSPDGELIRHLGDIAARLGFNPRSSRSAIIRHAVAKLAAKVATLDAQSATWEALGIKHKRRRQG